MHSNKPNLGVVRVEGKRSVKQIDEEGNAQKGITRISHSCPRFQSWVYQAELAREPLRYLRRGQKAIVCDKVALIRQPIQSGNERF
jgi:hypothetical protein